MTPNPVKKTIGGVTFEDRFADLHEDTPETLAWQWARDAKAQAAAEASPNYEPVRQRLLSMLAAGGFFAPRKRGGRWFGRAVVDGDAVVQVSDTPAGGGRTLL
jgi:prolyl oligopeptidase